MAVSHILLTFKTYLNRRGRGVLKSGDFMWDVLYGWPPSRNVSDNFLKWLRQGQINLFGPCELLTCLKDRNKLHVLNLF